MLLLLSLADRYIELTLKYTGDKTNYLLDTTSLLYDLELLYDLSVIITEPIYSDYRFSRFFWYRNARRIKPPHRLRTLRIIKDSPLELTCIIPLGTFLLTFLTLCLIYVDGNERLTREANKRLSEISKEKIDINARIAEIDREIQARGADDILERIGKNLKGNPNKLLEVLIESYVVKNDNDEVDNGR